MSFDIEKLADLLSLVFQGFFNSFFFLMLQIVINVAALTIGIIALIGKSF